MRNALLVLLAVFTLYFGEWIYRSFLRPIDKPTQSMISLAKHFNDVGLKGHLYPVRHGYRHTQITAASAFQIDGYSLPIVLEECSNEFVAANHLSVIQASPNLTHGQRNDLLVLNLPMWGDDTDTMATRVTNAFTSFKQ